MHLEKLEIHGFKSFANRTSLEFGTGITAIVGPNGSGKSNVADAIRWVLGETSLKLIRGKKAEDVIFAGSDRKTKLGMAEVSLYLNNEDGAADVDFSELVITRRVYRDGTGEYLINKRVVRLQDIQMLLAQANFGQRTYSVIGQGMVDQILMTSPQERKHFFDEAAGVRQFQLKREQAVTKLQHTRENLRQAEVLIAEIEPRLRSLTRQVRRLERRTEVERQLLELQTAYYRGLLQDLRRQLASAHEQQAAYDRTRTQQEAVVNGLNAELAKLEHEQTRTELFTNLQRQFERLQADKGVLLAEAAVLTGQRDASFTRQGKGNLVWIEKQAAAVEKQLREVNAEAAALKAAIQADEKKRQQLESATAVQDENFKAIGRALDDAQRRLQQGTVSLPEVQDEVREFAAFERAFLEELQTVATLEGLAALKRRAEELDRRTARFVERIERVGSIDAGREALELQQRLQQAVSERDRNAAASSELLVSLNVRREKQHLISSQQTRLNEERERLERELARARAETSSDIDATLKRQTSELEQKIAAVDRQLETVTADIQRFNTGETEKRETLFRLQRDLRTAQERLDETALALNQVNVDVARIETRLQDVEREVHEEVAEAHWSSMLESTESAPPPKPEQNEEILRVKHQLALIGGTDEGVEQEYTQTNERYTFLKTQFDDLIKAAAQLEDGIAQLDKTIKQQFDRAFAAINEEFGKFFKMLFRGGTAKLVLLKEEIIEESEGDEDSEADEPEAEAVAAPKPTGEKVITGIDIQATPPANG